MKSIRTGRGGRRARARRRSASRLRPAQIIPRADRRWYGKVVGVSWVGLRGRGELFNVWTAHPPRSAWSKARFDLAVTGFECRATRSGSVIFHGSNGDTRQMPDGRFQLGVTSAHRPHGLQLWVDRDVLIPAIPYENEAEAPIWQPDPSWRGLPAWKPAERGEMLWRMNVLLVSKDPGDVLADADHSDGMPIECTVCDDVFPDNGNDSTCSHLFWANGGLGWTGPGAVEYSLDEGDFRDALIWAGRRMTVGGMEGLRELAPLVSAARLDSRAARWARHRLESAMWAIFYDSSFGDQDRARLARDAVLAMDDKTPAYNRNVIVWIEEGARG